MENHTWFKVRPVEHMKRTILILASIVLIIAVISTITVLNRSDKEEEVKALSLEDTLGSIEDADTAEESAVEDNTVDNEVIHMMIGAEANVYASAPKVQSPYDQIKEDIKALKEADHDTVVKYFGNSDVFTDEIVADRVKASTITLIDSVDIGEGATKVVVHICTVDYTKMNQEYLSLEAKYKEQYGDSEMSVVDNELTYISEAKREIAQNLIDGEYNICFNIPITVTDEGITVSETLKQAITGGWYSGVGVELIAVPCILE